MEIVELSKGLKAIVDEEDWNFLGRHSWYILNADAYPYAATWVDGKHVYMHRMIMGFPKAHVTHINGDKLDNRKANLRLVSGTKRQQASNIYKNNTSGYRGVVWSKYHSKWISKINKEGKSYFLGHFDDLEEAARAYDDKALELYGRNAQTNEKLGLIKPRRTRND